jgi:D-alanyl-D-alanine carboxypeptidase (penicillin-binding protein 5/6)
MPRLETKTLRFLFVFFLPAALLLTGIALLVAIYYPRYRNQPPPTPSETTNRTFSFPVDISLHARSAVVLDYDTGRVLLARNAEEPLPLASLTKLMTMDIVESRPDFDPNRIVRVSATAGLNRVRGTSRLGLQVDDNVPIRTLLQGLAVGSANDAAYVLAADTKGSIDSFVQAMNEQAAKAGFHTLHFTDPNGYDGGNVASASEYAQFCRNYLHRHPGTIAEFHNLPSVTYSPAGRSPVTLPNRNPLLGVESRIDGLKTGYTNKAGCTLVLTGTHGSRRIIAVLLGIHGIDEHQCREWMKEDGLALWREWNRFVSIGNASEPHEAYREPPRSQRGWTPQDDRKWKRNWVERTKTFTSLSRIADLLVSEYAIKSTKVVG